MHDESWKEYPDKMDFPSSDEWKYIHYVLGVCQEIGIQNCTSYFTYDYNRKYCDLTYYSGFCFNTQYVYFDGTPRNIDKVHSEETFFQQSTVHDYYDLSYDEIMLLKKIYEFIIGEFP